MARERHCDKKKNCIILYSGHTSNKHEFGTGLYIRRHFMDNLLDFELVNEKNL